MAVGRTGTQVWLVTSNSADVRLYDFEPVVQAASFSLTGLPADIALATGNDRGWVTIPGSARIVVLDQAAPGVASEVSVGRMPTDLALAAGEDELLVVDRRGVDEAIGLIVDTGGAELAHFRLRPSTAGIAAGAAGRFYAAVARDNNVAVFERATGASVALAPTWRLGSGLGEELTWIARPLGDGRGRFATVTRPDTKLRAERAGPLLVRAVYSLGDHTPPYTFEVRLKPPLDLPQTVISKAQYDLTMNVLNLLNPIGVEVRTHRIRDHVVEVREGLIDAFPDYTYPNFRVPGPPPTGPMEEE
jgi:hypothetical protein